MHIQKLRKTGIRVLPVGFVVGVDPSEALAPRDGFGGEASDWVSGQGHGGESSGWTPCTEERTMSSDETFM